MLGLLGTINCAQVTYSGYLIDRECIRLCEGKTGACALDNTNVLTEPEKHSIHCLLLPVCIQSGYAVMEKDEQTELYSAKYILDSEGNANAEKAIRETNKGNDFLVTVTGDDDGTGTLINAAVEEFSPVLSAPTSAPSESSSTRNSLMCGISVMLLIPLLAVVTSGRLFAM